MMILAKKAIVYILGWGFILLGIVGLFLPVLQGIFFLLVGLLILSKESRLARNLIHRIRNRYPEQYQKVHDLKERLKNRLLGKTHH